ncbi:hypothetical protein [Vreelandella lutescens]|uniref:Uncharacterized protein n=1 Tax=Vreelandella lutescens TaxID=1602943 RepID=A0ABQ1PF65_9GAMM|nr:hypothetical protein [Halomonas lutescens]GGC96066.1 hypothetical protein GCM10011382_28190 [Halomonas lutescens]
MSGQDQAAGLRKWADLQRQQRDAEEDPSGVESDEAAPAAAVTAEEAAAHAQEAMAPTIAAAAEPATVTPPRPKRPLVVVGLPHAGAAQVDKVRGRLGQWSALGRQWAGDPQDWEIQVVMADSPSLAALTKERSRWALWISSDAEAFATMYRVLRQLRDHGGPRQLLALHEPHLPRQGLLDNLRDAAAHYLDIELLLLAR